MKLNFRKLKEHEIDVRIGSTKSEKGTTLLLYKDARCDMNILDETVGALNWKREHTRENANCIVSIWDGDKSQWVSKEDTGTESNTEQEKGLASDSFKRACFNWGIGRELYTAGLIWVGDEIVSKTTIKFKRFKVTKVAYDENGDISELVIVIDDYTQKVVFDMNYKIKPKKEDTIEDKPKVNKATLGQVVDIQRLYKDDADTLKKSLEKARVNKIEDLTLEQAKKMIEFKNEIKKD